MMYTLHASTADRNACEAMAYHRGRDAFRAQSVGVLRQQGCCSSSCCVLPSSLLPNVSARKERHHEVVATT
jgi:hypothetical protein